MKTRILLVTVLSVFILSSCSNMRYGYVPKVKAKKHQAVAEKPTHKRNKATVVVPTEANMPVFAKTPVGISDGSSELITSPTADKKMDFKTLRRVKKQLKNVAAEKAITIPREKTIQLKPGISKIKEKLSKSSATTDSKAIHSWLWYIVVGIIFIFLGIIIVWPLGWIFYIVGVIAILYGLLVLIDIA